MAGRQISESVAVRVLWGIRMRDGDGDGGWGWFSKLKFTASKSNYSPKLNH